MFRTVSILRVLLLSLFSLPLGCALDGYIHPLPPALAKAPAPLTPETLEVGDGVTRSEVRFPCGDTFCGAWLYHPNTAAPPPVVVMGHGFGGQREMILPDYAEAFARRGMAVLLFDYRFWGVSGGEPRFVIDPLAQKADYHSALAFVRQEPSLDSQRIGLWGTSYSGGHAISVAAEDGEVDAIALQVPSTDGLFIPDWAVVSDRLLPLARLSLRDRRRARRGGERVYIRAFGEPDEVAGLVGPEVMDAVDTFIPEGSTFSNHLAAKIALDLWRYRPTQVAKDVDCPALMILGQEDIVVSNKDALKAADKMAQASVVTLETGHFGIYSGAMFEASSELAAAFFESHLGLR